LLTVDERPSALLLTDDERNGLVDGSMLWRRAAATVAGVGALFSRHGLHVSASLAALGVPA
jgi:hypothetical protein